MVRDPVNCVAICRKIILFCTRHINITHTACRISLGILLHGISGCQVSGVRYFKTADRYACSRVIAASLYLQCRDTVGTFSQNTRRSNCCPVFCQRYRTRVSISMVDCQQNRIINQDKLIKGMASICRVMYTEILLQYFHIGYVYAQRNICLMLLSITASVHLVAGTDVQRIFVFHHAEASVFKRRNRISAEDADRPLALPVFIIFYNPYNFHRIVFARVIPSKYKKIIIFAGIKPSKFGKLHLNQFFRNKLIVWCIWFNTNIIFTDVFHAHEGAIVIFLQVRIYNASFIRSIVLPVYVFGNGGRSAVWIFLRRRNT